MERFRQIHMNVQVSEAEYEAYKLMSEPSATFRKFIHETLAPRERIAQEIEECDEIIAQQQTRKEGLKKLLAEFDIIVLAQDDAEQNRIKNLSGLLEKPYTLWTGINRRSAIELGNFKDKTEMEEWVKSRQNGELKNKIEGVR